MLTAINQHNYETMKKIAITMILLVCFGLINLSQDTTGTGQQKPKATYRVGAAVVTVWENEGEQGTWKNFEIEKIYKKEDQWLRTNSFNAKELLELRAAIDKAIDEEVVKQRGGRVPGRQRRVRLGHIDHCGRAAPGREALEL